MKIGISIANKVGRMEIAELIPTLASIGFETIQYELDDWKHNAGSTIQQLLQLEEIKVAKGLCKEHNISVCQTHPPIFHVIDKYEENNKQKDIQERCFEATAFLGAEWAVIHPQWPASGVDENNIDDVIKYNREYLSSVCEKAAQYGVSIAFENIKRYTEHNDWEIQRYGWKAEHLVDAVDNCGEKNVGVCIDTGHCMIAGIDPVTTISELGSRIKCVHIHDSDGSSDQHMLPYMATIDWPGVIRALQVSNYQGEFVLECHKAVRSMPTVELATQTYQLAYDIAKSMVAEYFGD